MKRRRVLGIVFLAGQRRAGSYGTTGPGQAFLYSNGTITILPQPSFSGPAGCQARAINNTGQIAGGPSIDSGGTVENLNTLIPAGSPYQIHNATALNTNGQIVANATYTPTGQTHALLLTPPEARPHRR